MPVILFKSIPLIGFRSPLQCVRRRSGGVLPHRHVWAQSGTASTSQPEEFGNNNVPDMPGAPMIASTSNAYVKHCVKLRTNSRYRNQAGRCLLVGRELLAEASGESAVLDVRVLFLPERPARGQAAKAEQQRQQAYPGRAAPARDTAAYASRPDREQVTGSRGSGRGAVPRDTDDAEAPEGLPGIRARGTVTVSEAVMKKLTGLESVDGIEAVAELDLPPLSDFSMPGTKVERLLALDRIQDPGNLGTLLRTAIAFGWDGVFLLPGCADPFGDKAVRSSRGAALRVAVGRGDLTVLQAVVKTHRLVMLAAEPEPESKGAVPRAGEGAGMSRQEVDGQVVIRGEERAGKGAEHPEGFVTSSPAVCLVLGSEGQGLSPEVQAACVPVAIPMHEAGDGAGMGVRSMESLNVGVAGGILMFMLSKGMPQLVSRLRTLVGSTVEQGKE